VKRLNWNALRVGDKVLVHDLTDPGGPLQSGTVAIVDTTRDSNDIGVRIRADDHPSKVTRPLRLTVHPDPRDVTEPCWRCDERAASGVGGP